MRLNQRLPRVKTSKHEPGFQIETLERLKSRANDFGILYLCIEEFIQFICQIVPFWLILDLP